MITLIFPAGVYAADHLSKLAPQDVECSLKKEASIKVYFNTTTRSFGIKEGRKPLSFVEHDLDHYDKNLWRFVCSSDTSLEKFLQGYKIALHGRKGCICLKAIERTKGRSIPSETSI